MKGILDFFKVLIFIFACVSYILISNLCCRLLITSAANLPDNSFFPIILILIYPITLIFVYLAKKVGGELKNFNPHKRFGNVVAISLCVLLTPSGLVFLKKAENMDNTVYVISILASLIISIFTTISFVKALTKEDNLY